MQVRDGVDLQQQVSGRDAQEVEQTRDGAEDLLRMQQSAEGVEAGQRDEEDDVGAGERLLERVDDRTDDDDQHDYRVDGAHQHRHEDLWTRATWRLARCNNKNDKLNTQ